MKLAGLVDAYKHGALKVEPNDCNSNYVSIGGAKLTHQQCNDFLRMLGWLDWDKQDFEVVDKTQKFIRGIYKIVTNPEILQSTEVTFQTRRIHDTLKYFDRICLKSPFFNMVVLRGMPGTGGVYAVYDGDSNTHLPVFNCRSLKQLGEFINEQV